MDKEQIQDYTRRISQANRSEIIAIVYELADRYLLEAQEALESSREEEFTAACGRALTCIQHLIDALNPDGELFGPLMSIYVYMNRELNAAQVMRDEKKLCWVRKELAELGGSFAEAAKQDNSPPMMQNAQTIIAGMTYGKNQLNEEIYEEGNNRGYQA